jgi:hypothetical protein
MRSTYNPTSILRVHGGAAAVLDRELRWRMKSAHYEQPLLKCVKEMEWTGNDTAGHGIWY